MPYGNTASKPVEAPQADVGSDALAVFFAQAREGARRGFQWAAPTLLVDALVLHYTCSPEAALSIAQDGFRVGANVEMSHNTRRPTGKPTEQGWLVYGHKMGSVNAKAGFDGRRDFVVLRPAQAVEAYNVGDGNIQTVLDRRGVCVLYVGRNNTIHSLVDGQWQTRESWQLHTPGGQAVLEGVPWKRLKTFLERTTRQMALQPQHHAEPDAQCETDDASPRG